ncbi:MULTISPECIES: group II intron reverse transcriptase/maturase [unclassified Caballeronia]|uniref:group II intron reverse transcriptase/maturase n=1 Tax=unclassified Caballeronia TaxID=2646786 RepID=UPI0028627914|nr:MULTISPECIES: group II intron reverse transcriptase/maturase [unclassified Caballeronia]MDR5754991.1 group II intron reverse transcriptase/maturase [Caballeronia sp. LZ024]MDR5845550.1 group II intron reverse transcriptase/maturase [Caballeronia sp. LZ031]
MRYAYDCTRKDGAVGVDGQSGEDYAVNLTQNLLGLVDRLKSGRYRALPVRRHFIAKADGSLRGLGIPAFEDKVAQRAIVMLLEPIYEHDFLDCSFGFRPGRSAHEALRSVWKGIMYRGGQWVLDVDVRKYFDSIDQVRLRELLARRVTDGVIRRLIDKWLKAGVLDNGQLSYPELGTPQGGVISPCLANVFLHYVLDEWFAAEVQPRLRGPSTLVRFADDFVVILAHKDDAERVLRVLRKRLGKYGLELHPDKTQMVDFRFKPQSGHDDHQEPLATTFNFLGFTHVWVTSEKGRAMVRQLTAKDRVARTLKAVSRVCRGMRTRPLRDQHQRLSRMLKGHYAYFGISGNFERLATLRNHVARIWRKWLSRRSNERSMPWVAFMRILTLFPLPHPRIVRRYAKP